MLYDRIKLRPHRALRTPRTLRTELCVASHIFNKRRYFSVRIANIAYVALWVGTPFTGFPTLPLRSDTDIFSENVVSF
jgi:hypothetical protein